MQKAVIYARFSSENQHAESIEAQVAECTSYCKRKGYLVVKIYADEALSGTTTAKRRSYNTMLVDARKGLFDVVIFHKIDRNARNEIDYYKFKQSILMLGLTYEYAAQPIDTSPEGQFMEAVMVGQAAYYSRNLSKETKIKAIPFAKKSCFMGGVAPFGYKIVNKKYEINEEEAPAIRDIFTMYLHGYSYTQILDHINSLGYRTRQGNPFFKNSLHDILRNARYCGTYTYNKVVKMPNGTRNSHAISPEVIVNKGAIPAIISEADFQRVQLMLDKKKRIPGIWTAKNTYLLSGQLRCGICGHTYIGRTDTVNGRKYQYYQCGSTRTQGSRYRCGNTRLKLIETEQKIIDAIIENFRKEDVDEIVAVAADKLNDNQEVVGRVKFLETKKRKLVTRMNNLYASLESSVMDEYDLAHLSDLKKDLKAVDKELAAARVIPETSFSKEELYAKWDEFIQVLKNKTDPTLVRSVLHILVNSIEVTPDYLTVTIDMKFTDLLVPGTGIEPVRVSLPEGF